MTTVKTFTLYAVAVFLLFAGCKSENDSNPEEFVGSWEVVSAERSGKSTETVVGAVFEFREDGTLKTDVLNGNVMEGPYTVNDNAIVHYVGDNIQMTYEVEWLQDNTLQLQTYIQGYAFSFVLHKIR